MTQPYDWRHPDDLDARLGEPADWTPGGIQGGPPMEAPDLRAQEG